MGDKSAEGRRRCNPRERLTLYCFANACMEDRRCLLHKFPKHAGPLSSLLDQLIDDIALLIDVAARFGLDAIAQVDLGTRIHRNHPIDELSPQALAIMQTVLARAGHAVAPVATLYRPGLDGT